MNKQKYTFLLIICLLISLWFSFTNIHNQHRINHSNCIRESKIHFIPTNNYDLRYIHHLELLENEIKQNYYLPIFYTNLQKTLGCIVRKVRFSSDGKLYVAGHTILADMLSIENNSVAHLQENFDIFVASFSLDLKTLHQATFLGGSENDFFSSMEIGPQGEVYITGYTYSSDFPGISEETNTPNRKRMDYCSGFISLLSPDLKTLHRTYLLTGNYNTYAHSMTISPDAHIYVAGSTFSTIFPGTTGGAQSSFGGLIDGFIAKLSPDLTTLYQTTYLGGLEHDGIGSILIGPEGDVYVIGHTLSSDFPKVQGGFQDTKAEFFNAFISRLSPDLSTIHQSTYLVGSKSSSILAIAFGPKGELYVAGGTDSSDFPGTEGGAQESHETCTFIGFIANLSLDLKTLHQATYLGGSAMDVVYTMQINPLGDIYVAGITYSFDFPNTKEGAQSSKKSSKKDKLEGFIAKLSPDLKTIHQATYLGGSKSNILYSMIIDSNGLVYVAGTTSSSDFPGTQNGAFETKGKTSPNGFIAKLSPDLKILHQASYTNWQ